MHNEFNDCHPPSRPLCLFVCYFLSYHCSFSNVSRKLEKTGKTKTRESSVVTGGNRYFWRLNITSIWCENLLEYLATGLIFSRKRTWLGTSYVPRLKYYYHELLMCNGHCRIGASLIIHYLELFRREQQLIDKWIRVSVILNVLWGQVILHPNQFSEKMYIFGFCHARCR